MKKLILLSLWLLGAAGQVAIAEDLIVGGQNVARRDPIADSTVGVFSPNADGHSGALCLGTLIRKDIALPAAHCIQPGTKPVLIFNRDLHAPGAIHRVAQGVSVNPKWAKRAGKGMDQGDIALVKFGGPTPAGYHPVLPVSSDSAIRNGEKVTLAGYGITNARTHAGAGRLRRAEGSVLNSRPGKSEMILDQAHGRGACHGDSGGPAFVKTRGGISLAGLTNRSYPDSAPDDCAHDVVYTKLPAYKSWIARSEKKLESNSPSNSFRKRMKNPLQTRAHLRVVRKERGARAHGAHTVAVHRSVPRHRHG